MRFALDEGQIDDVIKKLERFEQSVIKRTNQLVKQLTADGVEIAKSEVRRLDALDFGDLLESIDGVFDEASGVGIIYTDCAYAVFVEYGTGVVGARSPHPLGGIYDVNQHGEKGWWYFDNKRGKWRWTKGKESRPFMYNTWVALRDRLASLKEEVLR